MIARLARKRLHRPEVIRLLLRDALGIREAPVENRRHLLEAAGWLLRAQDATSDRGVAAAYSFDGGWIASYPETTGYIIPTLLTFADYAQEPVYRIRALEMAEWEIRVQQPGGGFPGHFVDRLNPPVVFNTGQIIFGLLAAHQTSGEAAFETAARRAAEWLVSVQDQDGAWRRFDYRGVVHTYNTRTAWALVELGRWTGQDAFIRAGERNLQWTMSRQLPNGWFQDCAFSPDRDPYLHTIAYASQGLLEAGLCLDRAEYISAARRACEAVLARTRADGWIAGTFAHDWRPTARYSCLTGNAQMAVQWFRLHGLTQEAVFLDAGHRVTGLLKRLQDRHTSNQNVRGAVKGSHPIWGRYLFGTFPNWATKFFIDALLAEEASRDGKALCLRVW